METKLKLTRDQVSDRITRSSFSYSLIGSREIAKLTSFIKIELDIFKNGDFWMSLNTPKNKDYWYKEDGSIAEYYFRCTGSYFTDREAISFNSDGFVGFAGWADNTNVQPFLIAFNYWLDWLNVP